MVKEFFDAYAGRAEELNLARDKIDLARSLRDEENGKIFRCNGSNQHYLNLIKALKKEEIPYIQTLNRGLIIRDEDVDRVRTLNAQAYRLDASYAITTTPQKLKQAISRKGKPDGIMTINGLDTGFCYYLANRCGGISPGYVVAIGDGHTSFSVRESQIYKPTIGPTEDFCKAYLAAQLQYYGGNIAWVREHAQAEENACVAAEEALEDGKECYICSQIDNSRYIVVSENGYQFISSSKEGEFVDKEIKITNERVYQELAKDMKQLHQKEVFYDKKEMEAAMKERADVIPELKEYYRMDMRIVSDVWIKNERLADQVDTIVREKMKKDDPELNGEGYFRKYKENTEKVLDALDKQMIPKGFDVEAFEKIGALEEKGRLELDYLKNVLQHTMNIYSSTERIKSAVELFI